MFQTLSGAKLTHVPYKGAGPAYIALVGSEVDLVIDTTAALLPLVRSGRVRALAIASRTRMADAPDIPTFTEAGLPGYAVSGFFGFLAPAATPRAIITKLNENLVVALKTPEMKERMSALGVDVVWSTPEEFGNQIREEIAQWTRAHDLDFVLAALEKAQVPSGKVYDVADIVKDAHLIARGMLEEHRLPDGKPVKLPGIVPKLSATPGATKWIGPKLGEHTDEVLQALGYDEVARVKLRERGIAATRQLAKRQLTWLRSMPERAVVVCDADRAAEAVLQAASAVWSDLS